MPNRRERLRRILPMLTVEAAAALLLMAGLAAPASAVQPEPTAPTASDASPDAPPDEDASSDASDSGAPEDSPSPTQDEEGQEDEGGFAVNSVPAPPNNNSSVITVKVGGDRTNPTDIGPLAGVELGFYDSQTGGTPRFTCTSDADGDCSIIVPNTGSSGANRDDQFWVRQISTAPGFYINDQLGIGETVSPNAYRFQTGTALRGGQTYRSTQHFMIGTGNTTNNASGGIWQNSRENPSFPAQCGIDVALVLDLSNSVTDQQLVELKEAANGFVNALTGTPSSVATFTFATDAPASSGDTLSMTPVSTPAGAQRVINQINGYAKPGGQAGGTNWDRGIHQVVRHDSNPDVAIVITDGNPTFFGAGEGPGTRTRFREVESGIFSANALKAQDTRVVALGVGSGSSGPGVYNLRSISGTEADSDYFQTANYDEAAAQLRDLALGNCEGSLSVVKQVVPPSGTVDDAQPAGGWSITAEGSAEVSVDDPATRETAPGTGAVTFPLEFTDPDGSGSVTVTETMQDGFEAGPAPVCFDVTTGEDIGVTDVSDTGFTVETSAATPVSCTIYNRAVEAPTASVVVEKSWVIDGTTYAHDERPPGFLAAVTLDDTTQAWEVPRTGYLAGDVATIAEGEVTYPRLCTLDSKTLSPVVDGEPGEPVDLTEPSEQTLTEGENRFQITNTLTCDTRLTVTKQVQGGDADPTEWTLEAIAPDGDALPGPSGVTGTPEASASVTSRVPYTLAESGGDPNYVQFLDPNAELRPGATGSWNCQEVDDDGNVIPGFQDGLNGGVTVPLGTSVRCQATNLTSTLLLRKEVENQAGGTATPGDWDLVATPVDPPEGVTEQSVTGSTAGSELELRPDVTYQLSEAGPDGYELVSLECQIGAEDPQEVTEVTLEALQYGECTFTNRDQPATLSLVKAVDNGETGGTAGPGDWTLSADGPTPISGAGNSDAVTDQTVNAGDYTLSESGGPGGYTASDWECEGATVADGTVSVPNGGDVTCTITNTAQPAQLTLVKEVTNDDGGEAAATDWTLTAEGPTTISGSTGDDAITGAAVPPGAYDLSESDGPDGYTASEWVCEGGTVADGTVTVPLGGDVTCTITNDDQPGTLSLVKDVVNDNGGTAGPGDWTLSAEGPTPISGAGNSDAVTDQPVAAGDYALSESGGPGGYAASDWECEGATVADGTVTVPNGGDVTCTITNDDQPAALTLVKVVDGDAAGSGRVPADWTLTADPDDSVPDQETVSGNGDPTSAGGVNEVPVNAGTYQLSEDGPGGFDPGEWVCEGGTVTQGEEEGAATLVAPLGGNVICTITNTANVPTLTLIKEVTNDDGGTAEVGDWTLTASGPTPITGVTGDTAITDAPVHVGSYDLSESGPAGYSGTWVCEGGTQDGAQVTLAEGDDVTCTITNDDQPGTLSLVKEVVNDDGGTAGPGDWTLSAEGPTPISGAGDSDAVTDQPVDAGDYALSESDGPDGYTASEWVCEGGTVADGTVTVPLGGDVTCTITNDDQPGTLSLVKDVVNDNGGTAEPGDWTLSAEGPTPISGAGNSDAVTDQPVAAGDYELSESDGPDGYTASEWECEGATVADGTVTVPLGGDVTCTITNDDAPALLTLVKTVENGETGGTAEAGDWTLTAAGQETTVTGPGNSEEVTEQGVPAGSYELSESGGPDGYAASGWTCEGGGLDGTTLTVPLGADVTCTIINTAQQSYLTLVKQVENGDTGRTAGPGDWTLTADGPTPVTGAGDSNAVVRQPAAVGDYELSEADGPGGYTASDWTCEGGSLEGATLSVVLGEDITCTITNTAERGSWTLAKSSDPASGSTVQPGSVVRYTLTVTNPDTVLIDDATVTDDLSAVLQHGRLVKVPAGATLDGTTLHWDVPDVAPDSQVRLRYRVRIDDSAHGVRIRNIATPGDGGTCVEPPARAVAAAVIAAPVCSTTHHTPPPPDSDPGPPGDDEPLPDTGGPDQWLLMVGLLLLLSGLGAVMVARRRRGQG